MLRYKIFIFIFSFFAYFLLHSCYKKTNTNEDFFYLQNKNVYMPVWVRGNMNASQIIIVIHGGPGGDDGIYMNLFSFKQLEQNYLLVYYDQRASGASQSSFLGNYSADDHIQDLEKLVHLIHEKYGKNRTIQLLGHSWGGMLGGLYLQKGRNREIIKGFIDVDGAYETIARNEYDALISTAQAQISLGNSISFWDKVLKDLSKINPEQLSLLELSAINILGYKGETILQNDKITNGGEGFDAYNYYFNSSYHPSIYAMNELFINTLMFKQAYKNNLSLKNEIDKLLTPTCLFWGRYDLIVASSTLEILFDTLPNVVFSSYFEYSGHSAMITEPIEFIANISTCMKVFTEQTK